MQANRTGEATAERSADIRLSIHRLPDVPAPAAAPDGRPGERGRPRHAAADELEGGRAGPRAADQGARARWRTPPASPSRASATRSSAGRPALIRSRPLIQDLAKLGKQLDPTSKNLDELTTSLNETGGVERINDFVYYGRSPRTGSTRSATTSAPRSSPTRATSTSSPRCSSAWRTFYTPATAASAKSTCSTRSRPRRRRARRRAGSGRRARLLQGLIGALRTVLRARARRPRSSACSARPAEPSKGLQAR